MPVTRRTKIYTSLRWGVYFVPVLALVRLRLRLTRRSRLDSVLVVCVYRRRWSAPLAVLARSLVDHGAEVRLWALEEMDDRLSPWTTGVGPGEKFALSNDLIAGSDRPDPTVIVLDDDTDLTIGRILDLVGLVDAAALDLAQPAHDRQSHHSHGITVRRRDSLVRLTSFVEIGPAFLVAARSRDRFLPFPVSDMGWGLELRWFDEQRAGARLGVVDAVPMRHLGVVGVSYDSAEARDSLAARFESADASSWADVQQVVATWRPWSRRPPWLSDRAAQTSDE